jgi:hypothetical protein
MLRVREQDALNGDLKIDLPAVDGTPLHFFEFVFG